jgi:hypothetical protein
MDMNMLFLSRHLRRVLLFFVALTTFCGTVAAQELSREDALKEAGRLGTEAERIRGENHSGARSLARGETLLTVSSQLPRNSAGFTRYSMTWAVKGMPKWR